MPVVFTIIYLRKGVTNSSERTANSTMYGVAAHPISWIPLVGLGGVDLLDLTPMHCVDIGERTASLSHYPKRSR